MLPSQNSSFKHSAECIAAFKLFGDVPTLTIIYYLSEGPKRFSELERLTQTNPVTLTARLKKLVTQNIVERKEQEQDSQSVTYSLTELGLKALPILQQIDTFSKELPV
jgi:DNA-binding HxlR family transcriptional regulator